MNDSEQDYAHRVAREITNKHFEQAAVLAAQLAGGGKAEPAEVLFYSAAQMAAQTTLTEMHREVLAAQAAVVAVGKSLEPALLALMEEHPESPAVDLLIAARRDFALYCSATWERFWKAHEEHFADFVGIKARALNAAFTPDYSTMADDFLAMGEADEFHPFYLWYAGGVNTFSEYTKLMGSKEPMSSEALHAAFVRLSGEASITTRAVEFVRWVRGAWREVQGEVQKVAKDQPLPTLEMSYQIGKALRQHYGSKAE